MPRPLPAPGAGPGWRAAAPPPGTVNDGADLAERHTEDVVQDEREPLGGSQRVQHHHQRGTDRIGQQRLVLRAGLAGRPEARVKLGRLGRQRPSQLLPPGPAGLQHVQADPGHDRSQPPGRILHLTTVGTADPQPRLLQRVLGITARSEHPVGQRHQPARLKLTPGRR